MRIGFLVLVLLINCINSILAESVFRTVFNDLHREPPLPFIPPRSTSIRTEWIEQKVDNFNESDTRTWKMRYMVNDQYFKEGGPIFIFVGGEWIISEGYLRTGHMFDMAKELNGYLFYTEHRYYGESHLFDDLSTENLRYLNVDQSLADLAHFIRTVKKTIPGLKNSGVILVGGSYSATMVTWFKRIYPELATGSWGSSAPLLAKVDFTEYKEVVGQSIKLMGGQKCYDRIENSVKEMEKMFAKNKIDKIKNNFNMCDNFDATNQLDIWSFFGTFSDLFAGLVQGHNAGDIESACEKILADDDDISGVANFIRSKIKTNKTCNDFTYLDYVDSLRNITIDPRSIMRQWYYQTCSEYGWYQTSGSRDQPFGSQFPVELYILSCKDVFGEEFTNATIYNNVKRTNSIYGGMNPEVSNVILTHGQLDPWRMMGIQEHSGGESNVIPSYAHCKDLASITSKDTEDMKNTKKGVTKAIQSWLKLDRISKYKNYKMQ